MTTLPHLVPGELRHSFQTKMQALGGVYRTTVPDGHTEIGGVSRAPESEERLLGPADPLAKLFIQCGVSD